MINFLRDQTSTEVEVADDLITGLPGRAALFEKLAALPTGIGVALLCVDLDHITQLNEAMGLAAGDIVLTETARRIKSHLTTSGFVARYGGDEFAILLEDVYNYSQLHAIASAFIDELMHPYWVAGREVFVGASVGAACTILFKDNFNLCSTTTNDLILQHAKIALSKAKMISRGSWLLYEPTMIPTIGTRIILETELALAIEQEEFLVYYQPKASCSSGAITSFEALIRWKHPRRGIVSPTEFIPVLEETGLIHQVGAWVLRTACQQLMSWSSSGHTGLTIAVNVSLRQLADRNFPSLVKSVLRDTRLVAERLELELTESLLMQSVQHTEVVLHELKELGVRLSIDDFGTGYSSLSYLKRLPINTIKIDKAFIQDITTSPNDASITRAIIGMAHSLNLSLVAEGVETEAQLSKLVVERCETVQGYFIGKPMPGLEATEMLRSGWHIPEHLIGRPKRARTLLLVDDEQSIISALKRLLRREGYRILSANSGAEGLDLLAKNDVDVIISDQRMPNMTGEEFLFLAKDLYPETVRMVLSGYADMQSITNAINQGSIYKFLSKPWDDSSLKETILDAFKSKELSDEHARLTREVALMNEELNQNNRNLAILLEEQAYRTKIGQRALSIGQHTFHNLPVPVLAVDQTGVIVLRNDAFVQLGINEDCISEISDQLPDWPSTEVGHCDFREPEGRGWRVAGRNLAKDGRHLGLIMAFISELTV